MKAQTVKSVSTIDHKPHAKFFRESTWLMIATMLGGVLTFGVQVLSKRVSPAEYAAFVTLMALITSIPSMPLQMVFVQQTARSLALGRERQLSGMVRLTWLWSSVFWIIGAAIVIFFQNEIVTRWQLPNVFSLWITLAAILISLWSPLFGGVLQGRQDFFWMGWSAIIGNAGRPLAACILVLAFSCGAAGMLAGTLVGVGAIAFIAMWRTRDLWLLPREKFDGVSLLRQVVPLVFGFAAGQFMFTADTMFAKAFFPSSQMAPYGAAGILSRGILWTVMPIAAVMFPKVVHATAKSEKSNLFLIVLAGTAIIAGGGAVFLWLFGPLIVRLFSKPEYVTVATTLIPWYAVAMVPLALANVMVNDLLARGKFAVVPWMVLLAIAYGFTLVFVLHHFPGRLTAVLQTLAAFNFLLFLICGCFAWRQKSQDVKSPLNPL